MPYLKKRGKTYYIRFSRQVDGKKETVRFSLKTRKKFVAEQHLKKLETFLDLGQINPFGPDFDIQSVLQTGTSSGGPRTLRDTLDLFKEAKPHRKARTLQAYEDNVGYFLSFNGIEFQPLRSIKKKHVITFLMRSGVSTNTRHTNKRHMVAWWRFVMKKGWSDVNIMEDIPLPEKEENVLKKMLSKAELKKLFETFDTHHKELRKKKTYQRTQEQAWFKPMIALYYYAGLRLNDVAYNPDQAEDPAENTTGLKGKNIKGNFRFIQIEKGKRNRERLIPISEKFLRPYLVEYFKNRPSTVPEDYLFVSHKGLPIRGKHVRKIFNFYLKKAGIPKDRTIHGMRHKRVTTWLELGYSLAEAKYLAGHSSTKVTDEVYSHLAGQRMYKKMQRIEEVIDNDDSVDIDSEVDVFSGRVEE